LRDGERSVLVLTIMTLVGRAHYRCDPLWTLNRLMAQCGGTAADAVTEVVEALRRKGLIVASGDDPPVYLPACALEAIELRDILAAVREEGEISGQLPAVRDIMGRISAAIGQTLQGQTLKDLVLAEDQGLTRRPE
jgi:DNA-binding IscR family transcriptional regulator